MAVKIHKPKKRISFKSIALSVLLGLGALGVTAYLGISNWRIFQEQQVVGAQVKKLESQIEVLQERQQMLKAGLNASQGEDYQEEKMREQGYKKPGEEVIAVLQDKPSGATNQGGAATGGSGFWQVLWQKIQGLRP